MCVCVYIYIYIYIYEDVFQLGKLKESCLLLKLCRKPRKIFLSYRREFNPINAGTWESTITSHILGVTFHANLIEDGGALIVNILVFDCVFICKREILSLSSTLKYLKFPFLK